MLCFVYTFYGFCMPYNKIAWTNFSYAYRRYIFVAEIFHVLTTIHFTVK